MATPVLLAGLPGKMAEEVARVVLASKDCELLGQAYSDPKRHGEELLVDGHKIRLIGSDHRTDIVAPTGTVVVDYTTPDAALENAQWYVEQGLPFVMGTTGYDFQRALNLVANSSISAVIAPNMAAPIVMLQAALDFLASEYAGSCKQSTLTVRESHQSGKRDTSGTAKAVVGSFQQLGLDFGVEDINKVRDPDIQRTELSVPEEHIGGHALHRYDLRAANDTVQIVLEHNVHGRRVYAEGTLLAIRFLRKQIEAGNQGAVYNMHDVLRGA